LERFLYRLKFLVPALRLASWRRLHLSESTRNKYLAVCVVFVVISVAAARVRSAEAQNLTFRIPPVKIPFTVNDQAVTITASALISMVSKDRDLDVFRLELSADLADVQRNMTGLLSSQLDKDDHCGAASPSRTRPWCLLNPLAWLRCSCIMNGGLASRLLGSNRLRGLSVGMRWLWLS
jgi:hypothetical protein